MPSNQVKLSGQIVEIDVLRHTPAGIPLLAFKVSHTSEQVEVGSRWQVRCEVRALALGTATQTATGLKIGDQVEITGFLSQTSQYNRQLVLHAQNIESI